ncbi:MAG: hypothetical protein IH602_02550 [Bryobacteraceae bacterium]|nr:hypothetical protein [Bryobacteraceae bacterium]
MRYSAIAALLLLASCSRQPDYYSPAAARPAARMIAPGELAHFTSMSAPGAANHIVSGVLDQGGDSWRWCGKDVELRFVVPVSRGLKFRTELAIADMTFSQTGPVRIDVSIEGGPPHAIDFDKPETRTVEWEIADGSVAVGQPVKVALTANKVWTPPEGGQPRAFILTSAGFVQ